jgi:flavin reductase (DIM6/NTAB) family NADH-FMN oxidoreductase RutF
MTALSSLPECPGTLENGLFQRIFRRHAAGVAVITASGHAPVGFTATSLVSLAVAPPLVSFNISQGASSWPTLESAEHVGIHLLARDQHDIARVFATSGIDRFAAAPSWRTGPFELPILDDVLAWMAARVRTRVIAGDHVVVIAEVVHAAYRDAAPLVYQDGRYTGLTA